MLPYRKIVPPVALIAVAVLGTVVLTAIDINIAISDPHPLPSGVRADARLWLTMLAVGGMVWLAVLALLAHYTRGRQLVMHRLYDLERTEPIPRIRITGTAAVVTPAGKDDELPGYAKGYVDGLTRKPMSNGNGKVIPIEGAKG